MIKSVILIFIVSMATSCFSGWETTSTEQLEKIRTALSQETVKLLGIDKELERRQNGKNGAMGEYDSVAMTNRIPTSATEDKERRIADDAKMRFEKESARRKRAAARWKYQNISVRSISQYKNNIQREMRDNLSKVETLTSNVAALQESKTHADDLKRCASLLNEFRSSDFASKWSKLSNMEYSGEFDSRFAQILRILEYIIPEEEILLRKEREDLWLLCVHHVRTWAELDAKIEAEKEEERKEKERREELRAILQDMRDERRVRALEDQNAILRDIEWDLNNLPPPVIINPPPRRRWR